MKKEEKERLRGGEKRKKKKSQEGEGKPLRGRTGARAGQREGGRQGRPEGRRVALPPPSTSAGSIFPPAAPLQLSAPRGRPPGRLPPLRAEPSRPCPPGTHRHHLGAEPHGGGRCRPRRPERETGDPGGGGPALAPGRAGRPVAGGARPRPRRPSSALFPTGRRSPAAAVAPGSAPKLTPARRGGAAAPRPPPTPGRGRRGSRRGTARLLPPAGGCAAPGSRRAAPGPGRAGGRSFHGRCGGGQPPRGPGLGGGAVRYEIRVRPGGHLLPRRQQGSAGGKRVAKVRLQH